MAETEQRTSSSHGGPRGATGGDGGGEPRIAGHPPKPLERTEPRHVLDYHVTEGEMEGGFFTTSIDAVRKWAQANSLWPIPLGLSCCAIEFMSVVSSKFDMARFGAEVVRHSPRQADLMIVAGTLTYKMASAAKRVYDQMPEPKWVVAMGACASSGGMYRVYSVVQGVDEILPVDYYISGCPPRPEAVLDTLMKLQQTIQSPEPRAQEITPAGKPVDHEPVPRDVGAPGAPYHGKQQPGSLEV